MDIYLGRIVKAFGLRGELKFRPSDNFWEALFRSGNLVLRTQTDGETLSRSVAIEKSRPPGGGYVITVAGADDRNAAENLVGSEIFIGEELIDVERPEELLPYQLLGMTARAEDGEVLGAVSGVLFSNAHDIYEITGPKGSLLIPAVPEFIVSIEESTRTIVVRRMPGLIED